MFVTGTIGDAGLGLRALLGEIGSLDQERLDLLGERYLLPEPRLGAARSLRDVASAAIDVSDGLVADAGHIAATSGVRLVLFAEALPFSEAAKAWLASERDHDAARAALATAGDDYEILFTGPESAGSAVAASGVAVACIGKVEAGQGTKLLGAGGAEIPVGRGGFTHF